ncbi:hypothetical protein SteCoe_13368 [Stentor coeruleus]|uniref:RING-type domain-containing protein n=1 Tax=Stentor coeruleus TaxID=5963 RepID=A0A1R2C8R0_9CILI|nr:hypothetical protein SteCoe_13368 [Stentor coeruleus]
MFLSKCSSCKGFFEEINFLYPGKCQKHKFCKICFDENSKKLSPELDCLDCMAFYNPNSNSESQSKCYYCNTTRAFTGTCKSHMMCQNCLKFPCSEMIKLCYECSRTWEKMCRICMRLLDEYLISCPSHLEHSYCKECFRDHIRNKNYYECAPCKKMLKKASNLQCYFCKTPKNLLKFPSCKHNICTQCAYLIGFFTPEANAELQKCCLPEIKLLSLTLHCQLCFAQVEGIPHMQILTCPYNHILCKACSIAPPLSSSLISCQYCYYFFTESKSESCIFCKKNKIDSISLNCSYHNICRSCLLFIQEHDLSLYINYQACKNCKTCSYSLTNLFPPIAITFFNENHLVNNFKKALCSFCNINTDIPSECSGRKLCVNCIKYKFVEVLKMIYCEKISRVIADACKRCFKITEFKIYNPACDFGHFYCEKCFFEFKNDKTIHQCQKCYWLYKKKNRQQCIFCSKLNSEGLQMCKKHYICGKCAHFITYKTNSIYANIIKCKFCKFSELFNHREEETKHKKQISYDDTKKELYEDHKPNLTQYLEHEETPENNTSMMPLEKLYNSNLGKYSNQPLFNILDCSKYALQNYYDSSYTLPSKNKKKYTNESPKDVIKSQALKSQYEGHVEALIPMNEFKPALKDKNKGKIKCCDEYWKKMACGHARCLICLSKKFKEDFEEFLNCILNRELEKLNNQILGIRCYKKYCCNNMCFPFISFAHIAEEVLQSRNIDKVMSQNYAMYFEGIKYQFIYCPRCKYITGYHKLCGKCIWCSLQLT